MACHEEPNLLVDALWVITLTVVLGYIAYQVAAALPLLMWWPR